MAPTKGKPQLENDDTIPGDQQLLAPVLAHIGHLVATTNQCKVVADFHQRAPDILCTDAQFDSKGSQVGFVHIKGDKVSYEMK